MDWGGAMVLRPRGEASDLEYLFEREILMVAVPYVAVTAAKIAAIGDLKLKISKRGNGRRVGNFACLNRSRGKALRAVSENNGRQ